jgi:hypothetical protein
MGLDRELERAAKLLQLSDVMLRSISADWGSARKLGMAITEQQLATQLKRPFCESVNTLKSTQGSEINFRHMFVIGAGVRLILQDAKGKLAESIEESIVATIECTFIGTFYEVIDGIAPLSPAALEKFGEHNAAFHIWPYWREVVQSAASRMGLPRIVLPPFRLKKAATPDHLN